MPQTVPAGAGAPAKGSRPPAKICPECGTRNNPGNAKCTKCKADLTGVKPSSGPSQTQTKKAFPPPKNKGKTPPKGSSQAPPGPKDKDGGNKKKTSSADSIWQKAYNAAKKAGADEKAARKAADNAVKMAGVKKSSETDEGDAGEATEFTLEAEVSKTHDDLMQAFGWAYVSELDGQPVADVSGEHAPIGEIEKGAYRFNLDARVAGDSHLIKGVGDLIESVVLTKEKYEAMGIDPQGLPLGWWIGFQVSDKEVWKKVRSGEYGMLSIHGSATKSANEGDLPLVSKAKGEVRSAGSYYDLSDLAKEYLNLEASAIRTERMSKGKGASRHGSSIKCPDIYDGLRREGHGKAKAAKISNECYESGQCRCH